MASDLTHFACVGVLSIKMLLLKVDCFWFCGNGRGCKEWSFQLQSMSWCFSLAPLGDKTKYGFLVIWGSLLSS